MRQKATARKTSFSENGSSDPYKVATSPNGTTPSKTRIRFYKYSCKFPYPLEAALVEHQLTLAHSHRNRLTEILLHSRQRYRELVRDYLNFDLEELEEQAQTLTNQIRTISQQITVWKIQHRTHKTHPELSASLRTAKIERATVQKEIKAIITAFKNDPILEAEIARLAKDTDTQIRETRIHYSHQLGLYWPNYLINERAANQARYNRKQPKYRRWTGEGEIAIQFQGGLSVQRLFSCKTSLLRIIAPDPAAIHPDGKIRGQARKVRALYRVASNQDSSPRWINLEVTMHRMLPAHGTLKWAHLQREKAPSAAGKDYLSITKDYDYYLCLTVEEPQFNPPHNAKVAVETGWRLFQNSLRVAVALGTDQKLLELRLPQKWIDGKKKARSLKSIIDKETNKTAAALKDQHPEIAAAIEKAGHLPGKRAAALLRLYHEIPPLQPVLENWRTHHLHLVRYAKGLNRRLDGQRLERYRAFVRELAKSYSVCAIANFDLTKITKRDLTKDKNPNPPHWYRRLANISCLTKLLNDQLECQKLPSTYKTKMCHTCRHVDEWDSDASIRHKCSNCQSEWDQDHNAAQNLLDCLLENETLVPASEPTEAIPNELQPVPAQTPETTAFL